MSESKQCSRYVLEVNVHCLLFRTKTTSNTLFTKHNELNSLSNEQVTADRSLVGHSSHVSNGAGCISTLSLIRRDDNYRKK